MSDSPIIVTGLGRSGTTWMQWFLSQHPQIHIHGQPPGELHWHEFWNWYQKLLKNSDWAIHGNGLHDYEFAHYAGSDRKRSGEVFKRMLRDYLTGFGPDAPRWGLKWIDVCADPDQVTQLESLWPDTVWVVCVRDPFRTIASARNTFVPTADLIRWATNWVAVCQFLARHDSSRTVVVQIDKLEQAPADVRREVLNGVLGCIGKEPAPETDAFIRCWPVVHKVIPDDQRSFSLDGETRQYLLDNVPELQTCLQQLGYSSAPTDLSTTPVDRPPACLSDPLIPSAELPLAIPSLSNFQGIERIRHLSNYGDHTLGMLLFSLCYAKSCQTVQREQSGRHRSRQIVEIGFNRGYSAIMLTAGLVESGSPGKVVSIDIRECREGRQNLQMQDGLADRHELIVGDSTQSADLVLSRLDGPIDLLFIDGRHTYEGCKRDYEVYSPFLAEDALLIFHDNYAEGIRRAIDETSDWNFVNLGGWAGLTVGTRQPY